MNSDSVTRGPAAHGAKAVGQGLPAWYGDAGVRGAVFWGREQPPRAPNPPMSAGTSAAQGLLRAMLLFPFPWHFIIKTCLKNYSGITKRRLFQEDNANSEA